MLDATLVTACTPDYLKRLQWSLPSWSVKPQFAELPLIIFHNGFGKSLDKLKALAQFWPGPSCRLVEWTMPEYDDARELMLSSFVLGAAAHVETEYYVKMDADAYCTDAQDVFDDADLDADMTSHRWGYTKPGWWVDRMDAFVRGEEYSGGKKDGGKRHSKRIISFCCLHSMEFVRWAARCSPLRLPIPSHDSYLCLLAERTSDVIVRRKNLKALGVNHCHRFRGLRENVCCGEGIWNEWANRELLSKVQIEITSACNMACPNCDRNCGTATTDERMTEEQIQRCADGKEWERIDIIGGEPTLHPDLKSILQYIRACRVTTNGKLPYDWPEWVKVRNSSEEKKHPRFETVNMAPKDEGIDDAQRCSIPWRCGIALSRYGYFCCGAGASVARVFGLDLGIKSLGAVTPEALRAQMKILCPLCGHSNSARKLSDKQETSPSWEKALAAYKVKPPEMTLY